MLPPVASRSIHWPTVMLVALFTLVAHLQASIAATVDVDPSVETFPVPSPPDAADDAAIWVHPSNPSSSVVIGTDKESGLAVYDLAGNLLQFLAHGEMNNVDIRYDFPLGGERVDLVTADNRSNDRIVAYKVDSTTRQLSAVHAGSGISTGISVYGYCMYASASGAFYGFVNSKSGEVEQWKLSDNGSGQVTGTLARTFSVGSQTEGCVADDELARFYIGEEDEGIWRYGAEPSDGSARSSVDTTSGGGHLTAEVEGLTLYYASDGAGYLLASSQGSDKFVIYDREGSNDYVGTFTIVASGGIDAVSYTDGIDVSNVALGPSFPEGLFVAQDDDNGSSNQNFKLVPWDEIANAFPSPLLIDTSWNPRGVATAPALSQAGGLLLPAALFACVWLSKRARR